jgi:hypothetical protein
VSNKNIEDIYSLYARAIDEKRYELLERVFHPEAELHYIVGSQEFSCDGSNAATYFKNFLNLCFWTNHLIGSPAIELGERTAFASARVQAVHQQKLDDGSISRWTIRGSYHDHMELFHDEWLITKRYCHTPDEEGEFLTTGVKLFNEVAWTSIDKISFQAHENP